MAGPKPHLPRLLVVDDEPSVLEIVGRVAEEAGFEVVTCHSGREAF
jgi:CheY-like chemotaxis protein